MYLEPLCSSTLRTYGLASCQHETAFLLTERRNPKHLLPGLRFRNLGSPLQSPRGLGGRESRLQISICTAQESFRLWATDSGRLLGHASACMGRARVLGRPYRATTRAG